MISHFSVLFSKTGRLAMHLTSKSTQQHIDNHSHIFQGIPHWNPCHRGNKRRLDHPARSTYDTRGPQLQSYFLQSKASWKLSCFLLNSTIFAVVSEWNLTNDCRNQWEWIQGARCGFLTDSNKYNCWTIKSLKEKEPLLRNIDIYCVFR